jgi:hypothetical protein
MDLKMYNLERNSLCDWTADKVFKTFAKIISATSICRETLNAFIKITVVGRDIHNLSLWHRQQGQKEAQYKYT